MIRRISVYMGLVLTAAILLAACSPNDSIGGAAGFQVQSSDSVRLTAEGASFSTLLDGPVLFTPTPSPPPTATAFPANTPMPQATIPMSRLQHIQPETPPLAAEVDIVVGGMRTPVTVVIAPDGRLFYTEKETGNVRVVVDGVILPEPVLTVPVSTGGEQGLLGIVLDPDFESNHHIWVSYTTQREANDGVKENRIIRFTEVNNLATDVVEAYNSPNSTDDATHNLNNMVFGPDGMLYVTIGDDSQSHLAQHLGDPRGKIHRFLSTIPLSVPSDNPFYDGDGPNEDSIYAYGLRNSFDFTFDPLAQETHILATENGPDCDDEVNLILSGHNYGWRERYDCEDPHRTLPEANTNPPMLSWEGTSSPTGIIVYTGDDFPEWYGNVFFCSYVDGLLHRLELNRERDAFRNHKSIDGLSCQTDILNGPDGSIYFLEGGGFGEGTLKRLYNANRQ